jgi:hypothetical protein
MFRLGPVGFPGAKAAYDQGILGNYAISDRGCRTGAAPGDSFASGGAAW